MNVEYKYVCSNYEKLIDQGLVFFFPSLKGIQSMTHIVFANYNIDFSSICHVSFILPLSQNKFSMDIRTQCLTVNLI